MSDTCICPVCEETVEMDSDVAPDEPACPACWSGWDDDFPVMVNE